MRQNNDRDFYVVLGDEVFIFDSKIERDNFLLLCDDTTAAPAKDAYKILDRS